MTDFESALLFIIRLIFYRKFLNKMLSKIIKWKNLKSQDFANRFKDNFIPSADNTVGK